MLMDAEPVFVHHSFHLRYARGSTSGAVCLLEEFWSIFRRGFVCYVGWKLKRVSCLMLI